MTPDITVLIPTYNRARDLARTLEAMVRAKKEDLGVEFVVVDNGSTDSTKLVVDSFRDRIPIQYLLEPRSGKNRALNCALEKARLSEIVVFTDDDVDVAPDWLVSIHSVCSRWPNHSVFGGRIDVVFPVSEIPKWAYDSLISSLAFTHHNYSDKERVYDNFDVPYGPNYWVRREIFDDGRRFDEAIGPHPTNRIMGDETSFLITLVREGCKIVYTPRAVVGHRVQPNLLNFTSVYRRAYQRGRGQAYIYGAPQDALLKSHPKAWRAYRCGAITWNAFNMLLSMVSSSNEMRRANSVQSVINIGYQIEAMALAKNRPG